MPTRPELYADKQNYRAYQINASMNGEQPVSKAEWLKKQAAKKKS